MTQNNPNLDLLNITVYTNLVKLSPLVISDILNEPPSEKTGLWGFRTGLTQTTLCSHRRWLEARNLGSRGIVLSLY